MGQVHEEFRAGSLIESGGLGKLSTTPRRLYVLCDYKLDPVYSCVQGAHAVAQYLLNHKGDENSYWQNEYLIFLRANVGYWRKKLRKLNRDFTSFFEPDLNMRMTAIALEDSGNLFRNLKTVKI